MRTALAVMLLLAGSGTAAAMGTEVSFELLAWSGDGSSALLLRVSAFDGDITTGYVVVAAGDPHPLGVDVSGPDVDPATCSRSLHALANVLANDDFRGVSVHADRCRRVARAGAVVVAAPAQRAAARSWVKPPAAALVTDDDDTIGVANGGGLLLLVFDTPGGGVPVRTHVVAFAPSGATIAAFTDVK